MGIKEKAFHNREVSDEGFLDWAFTNRQKGYDLFLWGEGLEALGYIDSIVGKWGVDYIAGIYVNPAYRNQGIGEALMERALDRFLVGDCHKAQLEVFADNKGAISFYFRLSSER
ncbi:MAG: GNAT family N-acetyltransferase [Candidatus Thorarchaeota archaeon]|nr:GNAT family N-acetyltransferase [Candidatus Thorarchaeota archaeon]